MMARRMMRKHHVRCRAGEKVEITSKPYLSLSLIEECGKMLAKGPPKRGKDGNVIKDKSGKVVYEPYVIKVLNTINFSKSLHYNPFAYIRSEKDILKLVTTIIVNTKGEGEKASEDFWVSATRSQAVKSLRTSNGFPLFGELVV